jgi:hypothetical protein
VKQLLQGKAGIILAVLVFAAGGAGVYFTVLQGDTAGEIADDTRNAILVDETGATFKVRLSEKSTEKDLVNPKTGKQGYRPEWCWWTKDGKVRAEPFPVVLNSLVGKTEPTFCPDCGRLVVPHNPQVRDGFPMPTVPPTKEEYGKRR